MCVCVGVAEEKDAAHRTHKHANTQILPLPSTGGASVAGVHQMGITYSIA